MLLRIIINKDIIKTRLIKFIINLVFSDNIKLIYLHLIRNSQFFVNHQDETWMLIFFFQTYY